MEKTRRMTVGQNVYDWLESLVTAVVVCILIFLFLFRIVNIDGSSMKPTLHDADKVVISRIHGPLQYGDVVVLTKTSWGEKSLVKRVIATEGQTVDIDFRAGVVYVDGVALQEAYTAAPTLRQQDFVGPVTVPKGCIFCLGDNRNESTDSRRSTIGMIDARCVLGKVLLRLWPIQDVGVVR